VEPKGKAVRSWARERIEATIGRSLRGAAVEGQDERVTELAVQAVLPAVDAMTLNDPAGFSRFLFDAFVPLRFASTDLAGAHGDSAPDADNRFRTLLWALRKRVPPFTSAEAVRLGLIADRLTGDRTSAGSDVWAADVGLDFVRASSFARKGRLLAMIVRVMRAQRIVEIGTSYGMSCLFLDSMLGEEDVIATVEASRPQVPMASELFKAECRSRVQLVDGMFPDVLAAVVDHVPQIDFVFHDAIHAGDAYVAHFAALEPHLVSGATVLFDDISWRDPVRGDVHGPADAYQGWREVAAHPRVARAVEIENSYGLLFLR
jgi:predicted O-methyltransferase YrrM